MHKRKEWSIVTALFIKVSQFSLLANKIFGKIVELFPFLILKMIFLAIYLKSVFPPYDSNIKFYNSKLYSTNNDLSKKDAPEYVYMF